MRLSGFFILGLQVFAKNKVAKLLYLYSTQIHNFHSLKNVAKITDNPSEFVLLYNIQKNHENKII